VYRYMHKISIRILTEHNSDFDPITSSTRWPWTFLARTFGAHREIMIKIVSRPHYNTHGEDGPSSIPTIGEWSLCHNLSHKKELRCQNEALQTHVEGIQKERVIWRILLFHQHKILAPCSHAQNVFAHEKFLGEKKSDSFKKIEIMQINFLSLQHTGMFPTFAR